MSRTSVSLSVEVSLSAFGQANLPKGRIEMAKKKIVKKTKKVAKKAGKEAMEK